MIHVQLCAASERAQQVATSTSPSASPVLPLEDITTSLEDSIGTNMVYWGTGDHLATMIPNLMHPVWKQGRRRCRHELPNTIENI